MLYLCKVCGWSGEVKTTPRCLPCYAKAVKEWRSKNPDKVKAQKLRYDKKFRTKWPEEYRAKRRLRYLPETARRKYEKRSVWLNEGNVTREDLQQIFRIYKGKCAYCGTPVKPRYTPNDPRGFDHVKSRFNGGKHERENIVVCCRRCNELKR